MLLVMAVSLYTSRVVLEALGVEDFGIYNVVGGVVAMLGVLNGAMSVSSQRYLTFELGRGDTIRLKQTFSMCFSIYVLLSILIVAVAETVGLWFLNNKMVIPENRLYAANWVYQLSILTFVNSLMMNPYNAVIIAHEKMNIYAYISILEVFLKLGILFLLVHIPYDNLIVYACLVFFVTFLISMIYQIYCTKHYSESKYHFYWDKPLFKQLVSYSGWNLFGSLSGLVKGQGLNILLNMFFNPAVNAARGIAYQVSGATTQFFMNFYAAVRPQITKYYAQNDLENMLNLVIRSTKFSSFLILLVSLPILVETPFIIKLWLGQLPDYVVDFTRLIIIITAIDSISNPLMTSCHATGHIKLYQSVVGGLVILNLPISYVLLSFMACSPITVFVVSLSLSIVAFFVRILILKRLIPFPIVRFIRETVLFSVAVAIFASIPPLLLKCYTDEKVIFSCVNIFVCIISTFFFIWFVGLSKKEKDIVFCQIKSKIKKNG